MFNGKKRKSAPALSSADSTVRKGLPPKAQEQDGAAVKPTAVKPTESAAAPAEAAAKLQAAAPALAPAAVETQPRATAMLPAPMPQAGGARLFMGAPPPPPGAVPKEAPGRRPRSQSVSAAKEGFWTQRGLPGFTLTVPEHVIKNPRPEGSSSSTEAAAPAGAVAASPAQKSPLPNPPLPQTPPQALNPLPPGDPKTWGIEATVQCLQRPVPPSQAISGASSSAAEPTETQLTLGSLARMRTLCRKDADRQAAIQIGGIDAVVGSMRRDLADEKVAEAGCAALRVLCTVGRGGGDGEGNRDGAIRGVIEAMHAHPTVHGIAEHGCCCLWTVCHGNGAEAARRKELVISSGGAAAITAAMRLPNSSGSHLLREASRALHHVCAGVDEGADSRRRAATASGALDTLASTLSAVPRFVEAVEEVCLALVTVCSGLMVEERQQAAIDAQLVPAVARGMAGCRPSAAVQEWGCKYIDLLCSGDGAKADGRRAAVAQAGGVAATLGALTAHLTSAYVQVRDARPRPRPGTAALASPTASPTARLPAGDSCATPRAAVQSARPHLLPSRSQEHGLRCLRQLCRGSDAGCGLRSDVALEMGAMPLLLAALSEHHANPTISIACFGVLEAFCTGTDAGSRRARVAEEGGIEAVVTAMRSSSAVERVGRGVLDALTHGEPILLKRAQDAGAHHSRGDSPAAAVPVAVAVDPA